MDGVAIETCWVSNENHTPVIYKQHKSTPISRDTTGQTPNLHTVHTVWHPHCLGLAFKCCKLRSTLRGIRAKAVNHHTMCLQSSGFKKTPCIIYDYLYTYIDIHKSNSQSGSWPTLHLQQHQNKVDNDEDDQSSNGTNRERRNPKCPMAMLSKWSPISTVIEILAKSSSRGLENYK